MARMASLVPQMLILENMFGKMIMWLRPSQAKPSQKKKNPSHCSDRHMLCVPPEVQSETNGCNS